MLLSILVPGKNDNFRKSNSKVLKFNLQKTIQNIKDLGVDDVELVLCDWGSEKKIVDEIVTEKHSNFKCVYVFPEIAQKYNGDWSYSIVHPINAAFRNSLGKYVIFWDSDCFVPYDTFEKLYSFVKHMDSVDDMSFYWGSRYNVPYEQYSFMETPEEMETYLKGSPDLHQDPMIYNGSFGGCGISLLMNRTLWESSTGWWEKLQYWGWQDIEFHNRLCTRYTYGGNLNDSGMNFYHLMFDVSGLKHPNFRANPTINSEQFESNPPSWGLQNETLEIIK